MPTNRELLLQRKGIKRGLPAPVETGGIDTSRRSGRGTPVTTGFQGIASREGAANLEEFPGVATGIRGTGASIAKRFAGLRPQSKKEGGIAAAAAAGVAAGAEEAAGVMAGGLQPIFNEAGEQIGLQGPERKKGLPAAAPKAGRPTIDFGLPTDRVPSFNELGGAIGQMFKYISGLSKFNKARGLTPGIPTAAKGTAGLTKAKLSTLAKMQENAIISGDKEKAAEIEGQLNAILQGADAGSFANEDLAAIENL